MTSSACDVNITFSKTSRETVTEVGSILARVRYIVSMVRRGGGAAAKRSLVLLCAVVVGRKS